MEKFYFIYDDAGHKFCKRGLDAENRIFIETKNARLTLEELIIQACNSDEAEKAYRKNQNH